MLTFEIGGRTAIPVRAIPFITGGCFDAERIVDLFYDPESWEGGPGNDSQDSALPIPKAFRVGAKGTASGVGASAWSLPREKLKYQSDAAPDSLEQLGVLPPAVFVWLDEFKPLYESLGADASVLRTVPAGAFGWDEEAVLTNAQQVLVWEGFASAPINANAQKRQQRNSRNPYLAKLAQEIDQIISDAGLLCATMRASSCAPSRSFRGLVCSLCARAVTDRR